MLRCSPRPLSLLAGFALFACQSEGSEAGDGGTETSDSTQTETGDSTQTETGDGDGDTALNPDPCDVIAQDCVAEPATKCAYLADDDVQTCVEPSGAQQAYEACERPNGIAGDDTCAAGLFCAWFGQPKTSPQTRQCLAHCSAEASCDTSERCIQVGGSADSNFGVCAPACDPFGSDCVEDASCKLTEQVAEQSTFGFVCTLSGDVAEDEPCQFTEDCADGLSCWAGACRRTCDMDHPCPATAACVTPEFADGYGACFNGDYECIGMLEPPVIEQPTATVTVNMLARAFTDIQVKVCAAEDVDCAMPLDMAVSAAGESVDVDVPLGVAGFDGYFEILAEGSVPQLYYAPMIISEPTEVFTTVWSEQMLSALTGSPIDPARGTVFSFVYDCSDVAAPGVSLSSDLADDMSVTMYDGAEFAMSPGNAPLTPGPGATGAYGLAAMVQHPVGLATLTYTVAADTLTERSAQVRAGALTQLDAAPTP